MNGRGVAPSERGETLVELLVTVLLLGTVLVALLFGIGSAIAGGDRHRQNSTAEGVLRNYAEAIQAAPPECPGSYATPPGFVAPSGAWSHQVTQARYFSGLSGGTPQWSGSCSTTNGVQQLSLQVKSPAGQHQAIATIVIAKRISP